MSVVLSDNDVKDLDGMIKKTPFEFAYPMFLLLKARIQEQAQAEAKAKTLKIVPPSQEEDAVVV